MRVIDLTLLLLLFILLSLNAKALAVASDYLENNTIILAEETSKIYSIRLQNPDSSEIKVKVDYDRGFMKAIDFKEEYILPPQSSTRIEFNVTAPKYNINNNLFVIGYTIHQLTAPSGGGVPFLTKINKNFNIKVEKKPGKSYINYDYLAYLIIVAAFIIYVFRKKYVKKPIQKSRKSLRKSGLLRN